MFARAMTIAVMLLGLMGALRSEAEAHAAGTIRGIHYASIVCVDEVQGIPQPKPDDPEFFVQCSVKATEVQVLCENPAGNQVAPGKSATQIVVQSDPAPIELDDFIADKKTKGRARKTIEVNTDEFLNHPEFCVNPNWTPIEAFLTKFSAKVDVFQCPDQICPQTPTSTEEWSCVAPPGTSVLNPPPEFDPLDPAPSAYTCTQVFKAHLQ